MTRAWTRRWVVLLVVALAGPALWPAEARADKPTVEQGQATCRLKVEGMTCGMCEKRVRKELSKLDGVKAAAVSWEEGTAEVTYDPAAVKTDAFLKAVERAGFKAEVVKE